MPLAMSTVKLEKPRMLRLLSISVMNNTPNTVPRIEPLPPNRLVPPITAAPMTSRKMRWPSTGEPVSSLNLHEQRFLEMAKALAGRPRLLLLDEVMAGLNDSEIATSVQIVKTIRDQLGTAILWVEHVMSAVVQLAERAIVLNFGKVLAEGAPEVVMRDPAVVDAYLGRPLHA